MAPRCKRKKGNGFECQCSCACVYKAMKKGTNTCSPQLPAHTQTAALRWILFVPLVISVDSPDYRNGDANSCQYQRAHREGIRPDREPRGKKKTQTLKSEVCIGGTEARLPGHDSDPDDTLPQGSYTESPVSHLPKLAMTGVVKHTITRLVIHSDLRWELWHLLGHITYYCSDTRGCF